MPFNEPAADVLGAFKPPVVSVHFGLLPKALMTRVKSWGLKILSSATTRSEALHLEANGVDAVIAQGYEAGGHLGMFLSDDLNNQVGTFALVRQIVNAVPIPVIAAGGIGDFTAMWAGQNLSACKAMPAAALTRSLVA